MTPLGPALLVPHRLSPPASTAPPVGRGARNGRGAGAVAMAARAQRGGGGGGGAMAAAAAAAGAVGELELRAAIGFNGSAGEGAT